jgi:hypothetical protein
MPPLSESPHRDAPYLVQDSLVIAALHRCYDS